MLEETFDTEQSAKPEDVMERKLELMEFGGKPDYSPVSWREYFDQMEDVRVGTADDGDVYRIYKAGHDGPLLVLLHGGGHSALSWAVFTTAIASRVTCRVLAMDLRGHGGTLVRQSDDYSTHAMSSDVANVIGACYGQTPPPIVLIGHGVGGAIAVHAASNMLLPSTVGLVAIDVVEGSATEALHNMQTFLKARPKSFKSMDHAIEWSVGSGQITNLESARVSMVGQIKRCGVEEAEAMEKASLAEKAGPTEKPGPVTDEVVEHNAESRDHSGEKENATSEGQVVYVWRIDLSKSEKYWDGWFRGTSNLFLACNLPKLLLLAGIDRLDRNLTIGQMQGRFMMQVLPPCGHAVQENRPEKVADAVASFLLRHKFAEARRETGSSNSFTQ
ncbi:protein phosphatase methylesterase 1 [Gasterosteus aculeatus]|nr:protein phosphatase methylesterase 1-like [Gasterosteus aculeatus aculeatus]